MKATEAKLLDFLKKSPQFIIPIYQRTYSWTEPQCRQLLDDILRTGRSDDVAAHFVGSIVYIEQGLYSVSDSSPLLVIDGQQRLTTVTLILEALARHVGEGEPVKGYSAVKLRNRYLKNPDEDDEDAYKLLLTQTDKSTLLAVVDQKDIPEEHSLRVKENFAFFDTQIAALGDPTSLCRGLSKLMVVDISLTRGMDNPQLIFESMNSTGKELSQADLIRNFILMGLEPKHQTKLYNDHWRPMEVTFGQEAYGDHFDAFMRHYLTVKTGEIPKLKNVYDVFKTHAQQKDVAQAGVDALVAEIHAFAGYYCALALGKEPDKELSEAFSDMQELKANVAFPFLLRLYEDYANGLLTASELCQLVRLVESYVFRRAVCAIPTNSMNKTFAQFYRAIKSENYVESVLAHFLLLRSYRRFPNDDEFRRELKVRDLYNFRSRSYWLRRLENFGRKERVYVGEYTIEHILPQNENLSPAWQEALGDDWANIQANWLHTLGNLTLTGYNSEYSDKPFHEKRDMVGGFGDSPLHVNAGLGKLSGWDEDAMKARADRLSNQAIDVWKSPILDVSRVEQYRPEKKTLGSVYSVEDHPKLADSEPMGPLYRQLRQEILALDPCVTEDFLKYYVAYKAETNFVDVFPKKSFLRLCLNMKYHEIHDERDITEDMTGKNRMGNGDVRFRIESAADLPYALGLIRQSFETQMGSAEE